MERALFLFMMFSFVGWLWESPFVSFKEKKWINRGFLRGPYIPIYGFAVMTVVFTMQIFEGSDQSNIAIVLIEMLYIGAVTALWEFCTHYMMEKVFHARWWDYSNHRFNIQGRISLSVTTFFALGGYILWRFVLPPFDTLYEMITPSMMTLMLITFYTIFVVDGIITTRELFSFRDLMILLEQTSEELKERLDIQVDNIKEQLQNRKTDMIESFNKLRDDIEERYNQLPDSSIPKRIESDLEKIKEAFNNRPRLTRFTKKFPNSYNTSLERLKASLSKLKERTKKS